nr:little elongation complex subunit 1 isoform X3 [Loxodonta africana]
MMPGETRSAAPGMAADLSRCQGCASLQQNLNEYVDALITLKQKIINTDNLLTEYQKKCDELQFARRENSTLHHQVEQMLQKISPLQKCQEELGSLKAELEEKKSSLKLYQETHQEYARVKEECLKSDAQKKKLEAKVKKLEEAAFKQIQDFKQLRNEKKVLEKEFKKTQERLDEFSKQKNEKELRHIGTQISSDSYGSIDKRKVKLLLKELWLCINTTHRLPGEGSKHSPEKSAKDNGCRESIEDDAFSPVPSSPPRSSDVQACLAELSMEIGGDFSASKNVDKEMPSGPSYGNEDRNPESVMPCQNDDESIDFSDHDPFFDEDLQAAMDFFRLPPPLLSPVPSPPLMSSPHLGPAPSSLALETCFGECTESSEDDSAQHRNSAEPVLEDDTAESQNYFGSFMGNEGSTTLFKQPTPHDAFQAPNTSGVNEATTVPLRTLTPGLQEHPTTHSLASEEHPTTSLQLMNVKNGGISDDTKRQTEVREVDKSVQTEEAVDEPPGALGVGKLSGSSAATGRSALCFSPLSKRPLSELLESGTLLSKIIGSPKSELTRRTLADEIASKSKRARTISELFRRVCREMEKERGGLRGLLLGELSESEEETPGDSVLAAGLDVDAGFSSSSTSGALSVCSGPPSSSGLQYDNDTRSPPRRVCTEVPHSEQRPAFAASSLFSLQSEVAPERSVGGNELEKSLRALHPELGAFNFNNRSSSEVECTKIVKGVTKIYSLPQSVFMKSTKDGQGESKGPRTDPALDKSGVTPSVSSQGDLVTSGFGFVKSSSWHHSDLLRRNEQGSLRAEWKHEQETSHQVGKAMPLLENRGSAPGLEPPTENNSPVQFKAASLLPNQVSVITKQVKPEKIQSAALERFRLQESEPALATENLRPGTDPMASTLKHGGDRQDETQMVSEVAATKRTSPEVSPSQRQLDSDSPSTVLPVENFPCSTNSRLTFSFKNIPVQHQDVVTEASAQEERQKQSQPLPTTNLEADKLPATKVIASGVCPSEEAPRGDPGGSACEAQAAAGGSPGTPQKSKGTLELTSRAPSGPVLEGSATTVTTSSSAFCRKDEEHLAECLLHSILSELNVQKTSTEDHNYIHALCRVYVGICRQLGDLERARLFCYSILKEDFPESDKLTLFIANMWHDVFISQSVINKAMQLVARQRAKGEVLNCLRAFLNWEKSAPVDVGFMVSKLLLTIQLCPKTEFQSSEKFGEDLSDNTWEYIFAIDLLCCHQKWIWTHDNIISKELWPVMDKWIKYRKGHVNIGHTPDVIIASVLRLIGRLGQLGLKEGFPSAVKNISAVIGMFIQHAQDEDIPWGVQLAAVYALCDLSPSNPTEISKILEAWRKEASQSVPAAIVSYLEEAGALCMEEHS